MAKNKKQSKLKLQQETLHVEGMHCAACEVLVEKELLAEQGVELADATLSDSQVEISRKQGVELDIDSINNRLAEYGYQLQREELEIVKRTPVISIRDGQLEIDVTRLFQGVLAVAIALALFFGYGQIQGFGLSADSGAVTSTAGLEVFVGLGLVAGFSTCAALVGGVILSMSRQWSANYSQRDSIVQQATPHIMFHLSRLVSFALLGAALGAILPLLVSILGEGASTIFQSSAYRNLIDLIVNILIFFLALQMLGVRWVSRIIPKLPKAVSHRVSNATVTRRFQPIMIGLYSFFIPCSFTLIAQTMALTSGNPVRGALIMTAFSLGTLLPLMAISVTSIGFNMNPHWATKFNIVLGIFLALVSATNLVGLIPTNVVLEDVELVQLDSQGRQVLEAVARGDSYYATGPVGLRAGVPAVIEIDNQGAVGCYTFVKIPGLVEEFLPLQAGLNYLEFTPTKTGTFAMDCAMEMSPQPLWFEVVDADVNSKS